MFPLKRCLAVVSAAIVALIIVIYVAHLMTSPSGEPCSYFDTVNITGDSILADGSYLHDGVAIAAAFIRSYDYIYKNEERLTVEPHLRGCICQFKPCIHLCCPWGTIFNITSRNCESTAGDGFAWPDSTLDVAFEKDERKLVDIFKQFVVQIYRPCAKMNLILPEIYEYDKWTLFADGTLLRMSTMEHLQKDDFCLFAGIVNDIGSYVINPANCHETTLTMIMKKTLLIVSIISLPFIALTIVVYLIIPELRKKNKALICYLSSAVISESLYDGHLISNYAETDMTSVSCKLIGYIVYYFTLSSYFWMSVISYDLWKTFRGMSGFSRIHGTKQFLLYSLYVWGSALICLTVTCLIQELTDLPYELKPGIGGGEYCYMILSNWSSLIYLCGPLIPVLLANITMFVLTAKNIRRQELDMSKFTSHADSSKNLNAEKDRYQLFLRLFIIMGITWTTEIISYWFPGARWEKIFYITDMFNAAQGLLIFILFVLKENVRLSVMNRILKRKSPDASNTSSTTTTTNVSENNQTPNKYELETETKTSVGAKGE